MVQASAKGTVAGYYLRRTEYYLTGKEPAGVVERLSRCHCRNSIRLASGDRVGDALG